MTHKKRIISNVKTIIHMIISMALYYLGVLILHKKISKRPKGIKIIAYHDIADDSYMNLQIPEMIFESHIKYLIRSNHKIIALEEAINLLKSNAVITEDTVVITFDDGYKSIYTTVFPIIKKYKVPITVFLTTDPLENKLPPFIDAIAYAIKKTASNILDLSAWNIKKYSLKSMPLKEKAMYEINEFSKNLCTKDRKKLLEYVFEQLGVSLNGEELRVKMLSWHDVIDMRKEGIVDFGAHTVSHPSLSRISPYEAREEILNSKNKIQGIIGSEVKSFAYPYGSDNDINEETIKIVKEAGFDCACILQNGINDSRVDPFLLKRICVTNQIKPRFLWIFAKATFAGELSGIWDILLYRKKGNISRSFNMDVKKNNEKINILFLIDMFYSIAGTEKHLAYLSTRLNKNRFNAIVCYFEGDKALAEHIQNDGIQAIGIPVSKIYDWNAFIKAFRLAKIIKKNKIDIVQTYHFKSDTYGVFISKLSGVSKIISSRRDSGDLKKPRQIFLNKIMNRFIDRFIMVCDNVGEKYHKLEHIPNDRMTTIHNGVDLKKFNPNNNFCSISLKEGLGIKGGDFVVGTTAIFRPEKAYDIFLKGIEKVIPFTLNLKVLMLGTGPTKEYLEDYCNKGSLKHITNFLGYVENVENYLSLMDVFCLVPNRNEGFSNAILEAMAMGKPVIATDVGGNAEAVIHNETGFIIPPDDSRSLSEAILKLYRDPAKRIEMGRKGRKRVEELFQLEKMIKEHEQLYEEVFSS